MLPELVRVILFFLSKNATGFDQDDAGLAAKRAFIDSLLYKLMVLQAAPREPSWTNTTPA